jgi:hypothetical protein
MTVLLQADHRFLLMMRSGQIERRNDAWWYGVRRIADHVVARLVESGRAASDGRKVWLSKPGATAP